MLRPAYPIATDRLLLRPYADDDFAFLCDLYARPDVMRYLYEEPRSPENVRELLDERKNNVALAKEGDYLSLLITRRDEPDTRIGNAMLAWISEQHAGAEVGYTIHPDHKGNG